MFTIDFQGKTVSWQGLWQVRRGAFLAGDSRFQPVMIPQTLRHTLLASSLALSASAATEWTGAADNDYNNALNWNPNLVPAATEDVAIATGAPVRNGNLERGAATDLSGDGQLSIQNGRFINGTGSAASFQMDGGVFNQTGNYFLVSTNRPGSFVQTAGVVNSTVDRGWFMSDSAESSGTYELAGGELNVSTSGSFNGNGNYAVHIGKNSGNDLLRVNGGSAVFTATEVNTRTYVSRGARIEVNSGTLAFNGFRFIAVGRDGDATTTSRMVINDGVVTADGIPSDGAVVIGNGNTGEISLNGGSLNLLTGPLWVGDGPAGGSYSQSAGSLALDNGQIVVGRNGWGTFTLDGGTASARNIQLNRDDAVLNLNGGTLTVEGIYGSTATRGTVNFNGTEIILGENFGGGLVLSNVTRANIGRDGLKISVGEAQEASIYQELVHSPGLGSRRDGGLLKRGAGNLYLDLPSSYTGPTRVEEGTLVLYHASLDDRSSVVLGGSAILNLAHTGTDTVRAVVIGNEELTAGIWGAPGSGAQFTHPQLDGLGLLNVTNGPAESPFESWILAAGLDDSLTLAETDADGDGQSNLIEFATGGAAGDTAVRGIHAPVVSGEGVVLTIAAREGAAFSEEGGSRVAVIDGIRYEVRASTDLVSWDAAVEEVSPVSGGLPEPVSPWGLHSFRIAGPASDRGFLRLDVSESP